jgi:hypothetical protein
MSSQKPSNNPNPPFPTPNPDDLQSEESQAVVHETLAQEQGKETNVIDDVEHTDTVVGGVDPTDGSTETMEVKPRETAYGLSSPPPAD